MKELTRVVLGLGTNCGDRQARLRQALRGLRELEVAGEFHFLEVSPIYESDAMLPENAPASWDRPFLNLCVSGLSDLEPEALLQRVKSIERSMGRLTGERWAPRTMDIDILAMGSRVHESAALRVPHSGLAERPFAVLPFKDLWPDWHFPEQGASSGRTAASVASCWELGRSDVPFHTRRTGDFLCQLVGILNVTPDSFSDGGKFLDPGRALRKVEELNSQGAAILDVGAESTRPGAQAVDAREEWARLAPVLEGARSQGVTLSVDTRHAEVARRSIEAGAQWINDVSGAEDPEMVRVVAESQAQLVLMHSLSVPARREETLPPDQDPVAAILRWAEVRLNRLDGAGIPRDRILFDPGIGFGKSPEQNLRILTEIRRFHELGVRLLVGHSRKSFLARWGDADARDRDIETATISCHLASQGVDFLRVHDVSLNHRALRMDALLGGRGSA